jgi:hypothetical protein
MILLHIVKSFRLYCPGRLGYCCILVLATGYMLHCQEINLQLD